jgi:hypothetical protein
MKMIKRLERLKNIVHEHMADLRPTSQNGSWSKSTTRCTNKLHAPEPCSEDDSCLLGKYVCLKMVLGPKHVAQ